MEEKKKMHPIVQQLAPSPEQTPPITSRGMDIVVTAGAGSGKTRTLVARYLSLLAEGVPLRSIAAITFTNKAAREMRNRVREEVRAYLLTEGLAPAERLRWQQVYEDLDGARISTIHSLAGEILRQHPAELGLDPGFETLDETQSGQLKAGAVEAALAWAGTDGQASRLFPLIGAWKLRRILGSLLDRRLDLAEALDQLPPDLWSVWQPYLIDPLKAFLEDPAVTAGLDSLAELKFDGSLERAQAAGDQMVDSLRVVIDCWEKIKESAPAGDWVRVSRLVGELGANLKQKGRAQNWEPAQPKAVIKEIQAIYNELIGRTELDLAVDQRLAQEVVPALRSTFQYADRWYAAARQEANSLDFDDLEEKVLCLLQEFPAAARYWQRSIQALLVDEYQDTNSRQRGLVNLLNGEDPGLFIVGDGKQSIYRFRGADVAVFREEHKRVEAEGEAYQLERSYRPHQTLLQNLNRLMGPVLGDRDDLPYLEPFKSLSAGRESAPAVELPAYIEVHLAAGSRNGGAGQKAAQAIAQRLLELIPDDPERAAGELTFSDAAVLCRASRSFTDFERAFDAAGIPYTTVSGQGFFERPEIRDVLNAMAAFQDPTNDLALTGLLRSPVIGFDDPTLFDLREYQRAQGLGSLLEGVRAYALTQEGELGVDLKTFLDLVDEFSTLAGRVTAAELISRFLERTDYGAGLLLAGQDRALGNLRKLILDAQTSGLVNLGDFLAAVEEIRAVAVREGEAQTAAQGAVQIMTVHQAKGLEFPIVILGDAAKREPFTRDLLIEERFGLVPPFNLTYLEEVPGEAPRIRSGRSTAYEMALESERLKEEAESRRLLYVAATRAQDLLLISGAVGKPTKNGKLPKLAGWLGELEAPLGLSEWDPILDPDGGTIHHNSYRSEDLAVELSIYEKGADLGIRSRPQQRGVLAAEEEIKAQWEKLNQTPQVQPAELERIFPASKAGAAAYIPALVTGQVVHRALELWKFPEAGGEDFLAWTDVELKSAGFYDPGALRAGYRRVVRILERFRASELYRRMEAAEIILREVPYHLEGDDGGLQSGAIDALFKEGERWILVEFKTDQIKAGEEIDWEGLDYQDQVQGYLDAAQRLLGSRPDPILCFLDVGGRIKEVTDRWG